MEYSRSQYTDVSETQKEHENNVNSSRIPIYIYTYIYIYYVYIRTFIWIYVKQLTFLRTSINKQHAQTDLGAAS